MSDISGLGEQQHRSRTQFSKTQLCRFFVQGECWNGESCSFAHGFDDLTRRPDLTKTSICRHWVQNKCPNDSDNCQFAHGTWELRVADNFMKTTLCRSFAQGHCDLGDLCRHAHNITELKQFFPDEAPGRNLPTSMRQGQPEDVSFYEGAYALPLLPDATVPEPPLPFLRGPTRAPPGHYIGNWMKDKGASSWDPEYSNDQQLRAAELKDLMLVKADARPPPAESMPMPSTLFFAPLAPQQGYCDQVGPAAAKALGPQPSYKSGKGASKGDAHKRRVPGPGSSATSEPLQKQLQILQEILQTQMQQRQTVSRRAQWARRGAAPETQHP